MQDLNDLALFAAVVRNNGFSAAARDLNIPKSKLSKHVARLEEQLGVRLLERSTRKLRVTEIGQVFYEHCQGLLDGIAMAEAEIAAVKAEPTGTVRLACPLGFTPMLADILPAFHRRYPGVRLLITATNRRIDLIEERIDVALRARDQLDTDNQLIIRRFGEVRQRLAASPTLLARFDDVTIDNLSEMPTLSMNEQHAADVWRLVDGEGNATEISHRPIIGCSDFLILERAAIEGMGVALLPDHICERAFRAGVLAPVLPEWSSGDVVVHLVFPSRHGMLPATRALIDYLADNLLNALQKCREITPRSAGSFEI
ncbi:MULTISPECIES: LysR family transcriptional regulator [unclassified Ensifer]|uniref:LysR family transcriptional regulator n=1 Tax=unclassified Ensifer TaxID=2633371 RepID=UPI0008136EB5|nr:MULTISPECIES: LysR family transcriptional regulator [unclassified Ensifer]OCP16615.1 LysR family transcriptional regulator [Ensifer sp. LC54]OCP20494.1 LysR family transcriptional regulator [Ensifer sp. LC384]OCP37171.1 LysR family transcriptional regulator [Ensifer sp. LC163]